MTMTPKAAQLIHAYEPIMPGMYANEYKMDLILTIEGSKHATEWHLFSPDAPDAASALPINPEQITRLETLFLELDIPFSILGPNLINRSQDDRPAFAHRIVYRLGHSVHDLELMETVWNDAIGYPTKVQLHGELSGFPPTAIAAFLIGPSERMPEKDIPKDVRLTPSYAFSRFALSRDHWQEELKTGEHWAEIIRTWAPDLYQQRLDQVAEWNTR